MKGFYTENNYCIFGEIQIVKSTVSPEFDLAYVFGNGITASSKIHTNLKNDLNYKIALLSQITFLK